MNEITSPQAELMNDDLFERKGSLIIDRITLRSCNEELLRQIFSNFFPFAIDTYHYRDYHDSICYFGVSPHFDKVELACIAPEYQAIIKTEENGNRVFEKFEKRNFQLNGQV